MSILHFLFKKSSFLEKNSVPVNDHIASNVILINYVIKILIDLTTCEQIHYWEYSTCLTSLTFNIFYANKMIVYF